MPTFANRCFEFILTHAASPTRESVPEDSRLVGGTTSGRTRAKFGSSMLEEKVLQQRERRAAGRPRIVLGRRIGRASSDAEIQDY